MPIARTIVAAICVIASTSQLGALVEGTEWLLNAYTLIALIFLITATCRHFKPHKTWVAPIAGFVFSTWLIIWSVVPASLLGGFIPTKGTLSALKVDAELAVGTITDSPPPVPDNPGIILAMLTAVTGISLLVDHAVNDLEAPALSGLFLLALWTPTLLVDVDVPLAVLLFAIASWLVLLTVSRDWAVDSFYQFGATAWALTAASLIIVIAVTVVVPQLGHHSWWGAYSRNSPGLKDSATAVAVPDTLELRHHLEDRSTVAMLRYQAEEQPDVLRLKVMDSFNDGRWQASTDIEGLEPLPSDLYLLGNLNDALQDFEGSPKKLRVEYTRLDENFAALPGPLLGIQPSENSWMTNTTTKELYAANSVSDSYVLIWDAHRPTAKQLSADTTDDLAKSRWAELDVPLPPSLAETLDEARGDAQNSYEIAASIQNWFRNEGDFSYSVTNDELSDDALADFMSTRTGFCVHYATAMTLMLREEGIPTRLAVGFLPGTSAGNDWYHVAPNHTHAWPEVYFDSYGWVRFEPTPSAQTGVAPAWTSEVGSSREEEIEPSPNESDEETNEDTSTAPSDEETKASGLEEPPLNTLRLPAVVGIVLGIAALLSALWWLLRSHRGKKSPTDLNDEIWSEARGIVQENFEDAGKLWFVSTTPIEVRENIVPLLPPESSTALDQLMSAIVARAYSNQDPPPDTELVDLHGAFKQSVKNDRRVARNTD